MPIAKTSITTGLAHSPLHLHQQKKKTSNAGTSSTTPTTPIPTPKPAAASAAKKKAVKLRGNKRVKLRSTIVGGHATGSASRHGHGHVLGGADYVDIMMGSRRREREEALKLPRDTDVA